MPSELASRVIAILSPAVGDFLARAKVTAACKMANADIETLNKTQIKDFAGMLEVVCKNLGPATAASIKDRVLTL